MDDAPPFAELPDEVSFTLDELASLLFVVDIAVEMTISGTPEHLAARRAQRLITFRLWPELGELLGNGEDEEQ